MQSHRRKYKSRFNANVHTINDKLNDIDERVFDVKAQHTRLLERVENLTVNSLPDLQEQVKALQDHVDAFPPALEKTTEAPLYERDDVKNNIQTLQDLVNGETRRETLIYFFIRLTSHRNAISSQEH